MPDFVSHLKDLASTLSEMGAVGGFEAHEGRADLQASASLSR